MNVKKLISILMVFAMLASFCACGAQEATPTAGTDAAGNTVTAITVTDMIGREVSVIPGT